VVVRRYDIVFHLPLSWRAFVAVHPCSQASLPNVVSVPDMATYFMRVLEASFPYD
jgi:hypothetical protein